MLLTIASRCTAVKRDTATEMENAPPESQRGVCTASSALLTARR